MANGTGNAKTRHIEKRYFFVKQHVDMGNIRLVHLPTEMMTADLLTKLMWGRTFYKLRDKILCEL